MDLIKGWKEWTRAREEGKMRNILMSSCRSNALTYQLFRCTPLFCCSRTVSGLWACKPATGFSVGGVLSFRMYGYPSSFPMLSCLPIVSRYVPLATCAPVEPSGGTPLPFTSSFQNLPFACETCRNISCRPTLFIFVDQNQDLDPATARNAATQPVVRCLSRPLP